MKILHTADLHLGAGRNSDNTRAERFQVFRRILSLIEQENIDILIISGDFLEQDRLQAEEFNEIITLLDQSRAEIYISPGNHDPASPISLYRNREIWPRNVHVFIEPEAVVSRLHKLVIAGAAFKNLYQRETLLNDISEAANNLRLNLEQAEDYLFLASLHGEVLTASSSLYNPILKSDIENSPFDYLALGHIHKPDLEILSAGETLYAQAGTPQALDKGDYGIRGAYILNFKNHRLNKKSYVSLAVRTYLNLNVQLNKVANNEDLLFAIERELEKVELDYQNQVENLSSVEGFGTEYIWNIYLSGTTKIDYKINLEAIRNILDDNGLNIASLQDNSSLDIDGYKLGAEDSLRGLFYRKIRDRIDILETELLKYKDVEDALKIGEQALSEKILEYNFEKNRIDLEFSNESLSQNPEFNRKSQEFEKLKTDIALLNRALELGLNSFRGE